MIDFAEPAVVAQMTETPRPRMVCIGLPRGSNWVYDAWTRRERYERTWHMPFPILDEAPCVPFYALPVIA